MLDGGVMSHISDMHYVYSPIVTTLRGCAACMVLSAPAGASHASGMMSGKMLYYA